MNTFKISNLSCFLCMVFMPFISLAQPVALLLPVAESSSVMPDARISCHGESLFGAQCDAKPCRVSTSCDGDNVVVRCSCDGGTRNVSLVYSTAMRQRTVAFASYLQQSNMGVSADVLRKIRLLAALNTNSYALYNTRAQHIERALSGLPATTRTRIMAYRNTLPNF